jgi:hypothetical protein
MAKVLIKVLIARGMSTLGKTSDFLQGAQEIQGAQSDLSTLEESGPTATER